MIRLILVFSAILHTGGKSHQNSRCCLCIICRTVNKAASDYTNTFLQIEICDYKYLEATF